MIRAFIFFALAALVASHQELSALYKEYQVAGGKGQPQKVVLPALKVKSPSSKDAAARDKSLFFPPLPGQSSSDYHPQLRAASPSNDTEIIFYSWHVHVYFFHEDANVTARTLALRDQFISTFSLATCSDECFMGGPFDTCNQGTKFYSYPLLSPYLQNLTKKLQSFLLFLQACACGTPCTAWTAPILMASGACTCPMSTWPRWSLG